MQQQQFGDKKFVNYIFMLLSPSYFWIGCTYVHFRSLALLFLYTLIRHIALFEKLIVLLQRTTSPWNKTLLLIIVFQNLPKGLQWKMKRLQNQNTWVLKGTLTNQRIWAIHSGSGSWYLKHIFLTHSSRFPLKRKV